ncbi:MAG: hypothetical protein A2X23_05580 [Chloroflexi bacterium GWC2_73_18]|nr:MAG: hypothetical protein A2X23_05580 [Chloroflexi bacterium GWC2_73_18]
MPAAAARAVACTALAASLAAGTATPTQHARAADAAVLIQDFAFRPATVTVVAGESVTWTMRSDPEQHTVTPDVAGDFEGSGYLSEAGSTFRVTFTTPGSHAYHCSLHSSMRGTVVVTAAPASPAPVTPTGAAASPAPGGDVSPAPGGPGSRGEEPGGGADDVLPLAIAVVAAALGLGLLRLRRP